MSYIVRILPSNQIIFVDEDETVLDAALKQDIDFPYSCMSAICSTCQGTLLYGEIDYQGEEPYGLEDTDRENQALFCSAFPKSDLIIDMPDVLGEKNYPVKQLNYHVETMTPFNERFFYIELSPEDAKLNYQAGQYVMMTNSQGESAPFSIANAPNSEGKLEFHVLNLTENAFSQQLISDCNAKNPISIKGPYGHCTYNEQPDLPIILVAGGIGFSQCHGLIEHAMAEGLPRPIHLYWSCRHENDFYLLDKIAQWQQHPNFSFTKCLFDATDSLKLYQQIHADHPQLDAIELFASGPQQMVSQLFDYMQKNGARRVLLHSDSVGFE